MSSAFPNNIQIDRLCGEIESLADFSSHPAPAVTRILFSPEDLAARAWLQKRVTEAGFSLKVDPVGNQFIKWQGSDPSLPSVATGSHIDAIPNAGKFDGVVGVLGGLEAMRSLKESGHVPKRSIELIAFTAEEPTRFGIGCLGSRMMSGALSADEASALRDPEDKSLKQLRPSDCPGDLDDVLLSPGRFSAFVELHIEQGPQLEESETDIGIVEKIAAPSAFRLTIKGNGGHAGAVLMPHRNDAFLTAAEIALAVERAAIESGSPDTVGTTGVVEVHPGAINSIPCDVTLEIDFRDTDWDAREAALARLKTEAHSIAGRRGTPLTWECLNSDPPAICNDDLVHSIEHISDEAGYSHSRMVSRAYHDSLFMARLCPITMIFIPCHKGYSHRPDEYSSPQAIAKGTAVLAETLRLLSS